MILPFLYSLMKQNGLFFSNLSIASIWLCFQDPLVVLSWLPHLPSTPALGERRPRPGRPAGWSAVLCLPLSLPRPAESVSLLPHSHLRARWGDGVARTHHAPGIGKRDQRKERGHPDGRTPLNPSLLSPAPLFSYPLFTVFSEHPMCPM